MRPPHAERAALLALTFCFVFGYVTAAAADTSKEPTSSSSSTEDDKPPRFSIGLGVLAPSYTQKFGADGKTKLDFNSEKNGAFSYSLSNVQHQVPSSAANTGAKQYSAKENEPFVNIFHKQGFGSFPELSQPKQPETAQQRPAPIHHNPQPVQAAPQHPQYQERPALDNQYAPQMPHPAVYMPQSYQPEPQTYREPRPPTQVYQAPHQPRQQSYQQQAYQPSLTPQVDYSSQLQHSPPQYQPQPAPQMSYQQQQHYNPQPQSQQVPYSPQQPFLGLSLNQASYQPQQSVPSNMFSAYQGQQSPHMAPHVQYSSGTPASSPFTPSGYPGMSMVGPYQSPSVPQPTSAADLQRLFSSLGISSNLY